MKQTLMKVGKLYETNGAGVYAYKVNSDYWIDGDLMYLGPGDVVLYLGEATRMGGHGKFLYGDKLVVIVSAAEENMGAKIEDWLTRVEGGAATTSNNNESP